MKVTFNDGSFLEVLADEAEDVTLVMCGKKGYNQVTMSSSDLNKSQVAELVKFLTEWLNKS